MNENRQFIRHPSDIPIEFRHGDDSAQPAVGRAHDVSFGGLAFQADQCPKAGTVIELRIPSVDPPFETRGEVVWCRQLDGQYEIGVRFLESTDAFKARMVEQVCHIEQYRRQVLEREGRELTSATAAQEWIERYASEFPGADAA